MRNFLFTFLLILTGFFCQGQELNCRVVVDGERAQISDRQIFRDMENAIQKFLNGQKWTSDFYSPEERINCNIAITITDMPAVGQCVATALIQSSRPVHNTNYETIMLYFADRDWNFEYTESQPMEFSQNYYNNNLTSMLAFYAFMILGIDYDSFALLGGNPHYVRALDIVNLAQATSVKGWQPVDSNRNRYWLITNYVNKQMEEYRRQLYYYHRLGLDVYQEKPKEAHANALALLEAISEIEKFNPNSILKISFFVAKREEIINIFKKAAPAQKREAYNICSRVEPNKTDRYREILQN